MSNQEIVDLITGIGTLVLSCIALGFSYYSWRKTSFRHLFKQKQLEAVFRLMDTLQDTIFSVERYDRGSSGASGSLIRFFHAREALVNHTSFIMSSALVTSEFMHRAYPFIHFSEDPYLPPILAERVRSFYAFDYQPVELDQFSSYTVIGGSIIGEPKQHYTISHPIYKDLGAMLKACVELDDAINKWLRSVGVDDVNRKVIVE